MKNKKITLPMIGLGMLVWHVIHVICITQIGWVRKMYEKLFVLIPSNLREKNPFQLVNLITSKI